MEPRQVKIGDRDISIQPYNGRKADIVGEMVSRILDKMPDLQFQMAEFSQRYAEQHKVVFTRGMAALPRFAATLKDVTPEDWERGGNKIELPGEPSDEQAFMHVFPTVWRTAREEVMTLAALSITPNSELKTAAAEGDPLKAVAKYRDMILDDTANLAQVVGVIAGAFAQAKDELQDEDIVGKVRGWIDNLRKARGGARQQSSSTDSAPSTDGESPTPSMTSPGEPS